MSAIILPRTIGGTTDNAITLCMHTGSESSSLTPSYPGCTTALWRKLSFGSNWSVLRMGITFAINDVSGSTYNRGGGFYWGVSSGSNYWFDLGGNATCAGMGVALMHSNWMQYNSDTYTNLVYRNDVTGSFYYMTSYGVRGFTTGSVQTPYAGYSGTGNYFWMPTVNQPNKKRGVMLLQVSASAGRWAVSLAGFLTGSLISKGANKDYTENDLVTALTSSQLKFPPTCSGALMDVVGDTAHVYNGVPLDTAFFVWCGVPIEIYNWYIYKVV